VSRGRESSGPGESAICPEELRRAILRTQVVVVTLREELNAAKEQIAELQRRLESVEGRR
jgi:hypothetical protein